MKHEMLASGWYRWSCLAKSRTCIKGNTVSLLSVATMVTNLREGQRMYHMEVSPDIRKYIE